LLQCIGAAPAGGGTFVFLAGVFPFDGCLFKSHLAAWAVGSACHAALQSTPGQLVFGQDMIWDTAHATDWQCVKQRMQMLSNENNEKENDKRTIDCDCTVGDSIMKIEAGALKTEQPREGPFNIIIRVQANSTMTMQRGPVKERLNMPQVTPCVEQTKN
jgi:hypothetical protein